MPPRNTLNITLVGFKRPGFESMKLTFEPLITFPRKCVKGMAHWLNVDP